MSGGRPTLCKLARAGDARPVIGVTLAEIAVIAEIARGSVSRNQKARRTRNRPPEIPEIPEIRRPSRGRRRATIRNTMTPLPRDPSQVVAELALDDRRRGVRCVGLAARHPRLRHLLRDIEPNTLEWDADLDRQRLGRTALVLAGENRVEHDAVAGPQDPARRGPGQRHRPLRKPAANSCRPACVPPGRHLPGACARRRCAQRRHRAIDRSRAPS